MFKHIYGIDSYNLFLLLLALPFALSSYTFSVSLILITYSFYRCFSKNFAKRKNELYKFENAFRNIKSQFLKVSKLIKNRFNYKIITCPNCSQKLRVPRFKGKLVITCKSCKHQFKFKS